MTNSSIFLNSISVITGLTPKLRETFSAIWLDGQIASILVQNGTARVKTGDFVKKGDILVEGIMEGKYTGIRNVPARAEIFAKILLEKEEKVPLKQ